MKTRNLLVKIVTVILFSLLILSFAVWGIGDIFRSGGSAVAVAEVGDTVIDQQAYARELSREVVNLNRRLGAQLTGQQMRAFGIPQQVLSRMISQAILDEQVARMGLLLTEDQMHRQLLENPGFQDGTGRFDGNRFTLFLRQINMTEQGYLALLSKESLRQQLTSAVTAAAVAPESLAEQFLSYRGERRIADYLTIDAARFEDIGEPDSTALQETYDNADSRFMKPAYKSISLAVLSVDDAAAEVAVSDARVAEAFEARKADLFAPERRSVSQAVVPDEAAAEALADRLAAGADFAAAVEEATGRPPVDLGTLSQNDLPAALGAPVFALAAGQTSRPIQSPLGWHVVLVREIEPAEEASLEDYADELRRTLVEEEAINIVVELANQFDEELASGASLEQAADQTNVELRKIAAIDSQGRAPNDEVLDGLPPLEDFLAVLNATPSGETSVLSESLEGDFFIVRVDGETPAQKQPLAEVREQVVELWRENERARRAKEMGDAIAGRLNEGRDIAAVAEAEGLSVEETPAVTRFENSQQQTLDPRIAPQLFEIDAGAAASFAVPGGQIVVQLKEVLPPDSEGRDTRLAEISEQLTSSLQDDIFQQFLAALQADFDVTVNQRLVDQIVTEF
ncbi:MAG: SurA N-terminal domain-containing protein [Kiloniellaceae bacterium]